MHLYLKVPENLMHLIFLCWGHLSPWPNFNSQWITFHTLSCLPFIPFEPVCYIHLLCDQLLLLCHYINYIFSSYGIILSYYYYYFPPCEMNHQLIIREPMSFDYLLHGLKQMQVWGCQVRTVWQMGKDCLFCLMLSCCSM